MMSRYRQQPALMELAQGCTDLLPDHVNPPNATDDQLLLSESHYNFRFDRNLAGQHFNSMPEKFEGPTFNGDSFTNLLQFDVSRASFMKCRWTLDYGIILTHSSVQ